MLKAMMRWRTFNQWTTEAVLAKFEGREPPPMPDGYEYWTGRSQVRYPDDEVPPPDTVAATRAGHALLKAEVAASRGV
ncbi:MAG: hypothetical protein JOZ99_15155 [Actinobacteria bacterium]|nr:hypothetical protein [Actinomycetota bacterium]